MPARERKKLTDAAIARLRPRTREYTVWDRTVPGLGIRVRPTGGKSYVLLEETGGRTKRVSLGPASTMTVAEARRACHERRACPVAVATGGSGALVTDEEEREESTMIRTFAIAAVCLAMGPDISGAAAQGRFPATGVGPDVCNSRQASCTTDREGRRWCRMPGQSRVMCGDTRFRMPQGAVGTLRNVVPEAIQRCVAAGVLRQGHFAGEESRAVLMPAIRAQCKEGGYRPFLGHDTANRLDRPQGQGREHDHADLLQQPGKLEANGLRSDDGYFAGALPDRRGGQRVQEAPRRRFRRLYGGALPGNGRFLQPPSGHIVRRPHINRCGVRPVYHSSFMSIPSRPPAPISARNGWRRSCSSGIRTPTGSIPRGSAICWA